MFHEQLDPMAAHNILGDKFNPEHSYFLMSDRDQFVVGETDSNGNLIEEIRLEEDEHDYSDSDESIEELFDVKLDDTEMPKDQVQEANKWLTIGMVTIMLIVVAVVVVTLISK